MIYTFKNNDTGEVFEKHMRMAEQKPYLEDNPNLSLVITAVKTVGGSGEFYSQTPDAFNSVLKHMKSASGEDCTIETK